MGLQSSAGLRGAPAVRSALPEGNREMGFLPAETPEREREGVEQNGDMRRWKRESVVFVGRVGYFTLSAVN